MPQGPPPRRGGAAARRARALATHLPATPRPAAAAAAAEPDPAHRQTKYSPAPPLDASVELPLPPHTSDVEQAKRDLSEFGMCTLTGAIDPDLLRRLRDQFDRQHDAEPRALGHRPARGRSGMSSLVNKGAVFLELIEHPATDALAGYLLGKHFLLSSCTGHCYNGPELTPQPLHRDQGFVPATADFPAVCNMFWILDDFTPDNGGTHLVPGSHRWPAASQAPPGPPRSRIHALSAPAGSVFCWDGRIWHGYGVNRNGERRRNIDTNFCLPWVRQQENWGVTTLQEVLDEASPKVRSRLGLRSYGTMGTFGGTAYLRPKAAEALREQRAREGWGPGPVVHPAPPIMGLGSGVVQIPEAVMGEGGAIHPMRRVSRRDVFVPPPARGGE